MGALPRINQKIQAAGSAGAAIQVESLIGHGGTGAVYKVKRGTDLLALKWYYPDVATPRLKDALRAMTRLKPGPKGVAWPIEIMESSDTGGFGVVTALRESRYKALDDLLLMRTSPTLRTALAAGLNLVRCFRAFHDKSLVVADITGADLLIDPTNGDVMLGNFDGYCQATGESPWRSAWRFDSPSRIADQASRGSVENDRFILAQFLFGLLVRQHPYEGRRWFELPPFETEALRKLYAEPVFIFDPADQSNRPDGKEFLPAVRRWENLPASIQDLFVEIFARSVNNPARRPDESAWERHLRGLRDQVCTCPADRAESFGVWDSGAFRATACRVCSAAFTPPMWISLWPADLGDSDEAGHSESHIVISDDCRLHAHHLAPPGAPADDTPVAIVNRHPKQPELVGLKNLTSKPWPCTLADGRAINVDPGRSVPLAVGVRIDFGPVRGEVRNAAPAAQPEGKILDEDSAGSTTPGVPSPAAAAERGTETRSGPPAQPQEVAAEGAAASNETDDEQGTIPAVFQDAVAIAEAETRPAAPPANPGPPA